MNEETTTGQYEWKNPNYEELANNNPALQFQYTPSLGDKIFRALGFRTGSVKAEDDFHNKAVQYEQQLRELDTEQQYNSAEEQARRLREAGINPNLAGGVTPGEAGQVDNQAIDTGETADNATNPSEVGRNLIGTLLNLGSTAISLASGTIGLKTAATGLGMNAYTMIKNYVADHPEMTDEEILTDLQGNGLLESMFTGAGKEKKALNMINAAKAGLSTILDTRTTEEGIAEKNLSIGKIKGHPYYSDDTSQGAKNWQPFLATAQKIAEVTNRKDLSRAEIEEGINSAFRELNKELLQKAKKGDAAALMSLNTLWDLFNQNDIKGTLSYAAAQGLAYGLEMGSDFSVTRKEKQPTREEGAGGRSSHKGGEGAISGRGINRHGAGTRSNYEEFNEIVRTAKTNWGREHTRLEGYDENGNYYRIRDHRREKREEAYWNSRNARTKKKYQRSK